MRQIFEPGIFKPMPPRNEMKNDATTRVVKEIMDGEAAARTRKTERLRAARLAREATEGSPSAMSTARARRKAVV